MEILNRRGDLPGMVFFVGATLRSIAMPDETPSASANRELAVEFVTAYVRRNQIGSDQFASLISTVHHALASLDKPS